MTKRRRSPRLLKTRILLTLVALAASFALLGDAWARRGQPNYQDSLAASGLIDVSFFAIP